MRFFEHFIKDAFDNPPYFTTAEVVGVNEENMRISIAYTDEHGEHQTTSIDVKSSTELTKFHLGDVLDIQICGGTYPALFYYIRPN